MPPTEERAAIHADAEQRIAELQAVLAVLEPDRDDPLVLSEIITIESEIAAAETVLQAWAGWINRAELNRALNLLNIHAPVTITRDPTCPTAQIATNGYAHQITIATHSTAERATESILHELAHAQQSERGLLHHRPYKTHIAEQSVADFTHDYTGNFDIATDEPTDLFIPIAIQDDHGIESQLTAAALQKILRQAGMLPQQQRNTTTTSTAHTAPGSKVWTIAMTTAGRHVSLPKIADESDR